MWHKPTFLKLIPLFLKILFSTSHISTLFMCVCTLSWTWSANQGKMKERLDRFVLGNLLNKGFSTLNDKTGHQLVSEICDLESGWWLNSSEESHPVNQNAIEIIWKLLDYAFQNFKSGPYSKLNESSNEKRTWNIVQVLVFKAIHHISWYGSQEGSDHFDPQTIHAQGSGLCDMVQRMAYNHPKEFIYMGELVFEDTLTSLSQSQSSTGEFLTFDFRLYKSIDTEIKFGFRNIHTQIPSKIKRKIQLWCSDVWFYNQDLSRSFWNYLMNWQAWNEPTNFFLCM